MESHYRQLHDETWYLKKEIVIMSEGICVSKRMSAKDKIDKIIPKRYYD